MMALTGEVGWHRIFDLISQENQLPISEGEDTGNYSHDTMEKEAHSHVLMYMYTGSE